MDDLHKMKVLNMLIKIHDVIMAFHNNKTYLGNLNIFSFRFNSEFDDEIRLV